MFLTNLVNLVADGLLAVVYPQACAICQGSVEQRQLGIACAACWNATRILRGNEVLCWKCGAPSPGVVPAGETETVRCRRCDSDAFNAARAGGAYEGALRASVLALKREPYLAPHVVSLLAATIQRQPLKNATRIIPVPLHPEREKQRGFNQATVIGRVLSLGSGLPLDEVSLIRTLHTERHRAGMDAANRRASVANAFAVRHSRVVAGERILLVDDVFTTGATVSACAAVLNEGGATAVYVLTIARTVS